MDFLALRGAAAYIHEDLEDTLAVVISRIFPFLPVLK